MTDPNTRPKCLVIGAGIQSHAIVDYLLDPEGKRPDDPLYDVTVVDRDTVALDALLRRFLAVDRCVGRIHTVLGDARAKARMADLMRGKNVAISASSYKLNLGLTEAAIAAKCHFVDLGGNDDVVAEQFKLHRDAVMAGCRIMPDSGVAPGAASILTKYGRDLFPEALSVRIYCGGLPQNPAGPLKYAKFFAISGLINEYKEKCRILKDNELQYVNGLDRSDRPEIHFPGLGILEAAYTSGGVSTMADSFAGCLDHLSYETLRYPGDPGTPSHWDIMRMYRDNGWFEDRWTKLHVKGVDMTPREMLEAYLDQTLPREQPDYLALMVELEAPDGRAMRLTVLDRMDPATGLSAMARTTGYTAAIEAMMMTTGPVRHAGVLRHEVNVPGAEFVRRWNEAGIGVHVSRWNRPKK